MSRPEDKKTTVNLKGAARLQVMTRFARRMVEGPEKHLNEPMVVGGRTVTISQFETMPNGAIRYQVEVKGVPGVTSARPDPLAEEGSAEAVPVRLKIVDSTGQVLTSATAPTDRGRSIPAATGPYRIEFEAPLRWKALEVPVELKGLAQP